MVIAAVIIIAAAIAAAYLLYPERISDHATVTPSPTPAPEVARVNITLSNYPELFEKDVIIVISENVSKTIEYNGWTLHRYPHLS